MRNAIFLIALVTLSACSKNNSSTNSSSGTNSLVATNNTTNVVTATCATSGAYSDLTSCRNATSAQCLPSIRMINNTQTVCYEPGSGWETCQGQTRWTVTWSPWCRQSGISPTGNITYIHNGTATCLKPSSRCECWSTPPVTQESCTIGTNNTCPSSIGTNEPVCPSTSPYPTPYPTASSDPDGPTLTRINPNFVVTGTSTYSTNFGRNQCQTNLTFKMRASSTIQGSGSYAFIKIADNSASLAAYSDARFAAIVQSTQAFGNFNISSTRTINSNFELPIHILFSVRSPAGKIRYYCFSAYPLVAFSSSACTQTLNDADRQTAWTLTPLMFADPSCLNL